MSGTCIRIPWTLGVVGIGVGISFGVLFGLLFSSALGNFTFMGLGLPIGLVLGAAVGTTNEEEAKKQGKIRPLTPQEQKGRNVGVKAEIMLLLLGRLAFITILLLV